MNKLSIKTKITIGVSLFAILVSLISALCVLYFSYHISDRTTKRNLIAAVEANMNELQIYSDRADLHLDDAFDVLVEYGDLFIEIDDDFTKEVNGITTSLYDGASVLYGESIIDAAEYPLQEIGIYGVTEGGNRYYIYDKKIKDEAHTLWLRGIVSRRADFVNTLSVIDNYLLFIPLLVLLTIGGVLLLTGRALKPIETISRSADEIRQGTDLTQRLDIPNDSKEIRRLSAAFNGMLERLEESFDRERRFNADISHELRTPVSVILSASELALEEKTTEEYEEALQLIQKQGNKMSLMINDMLAYARLGTQQIAFEETDLTALCREVCAEIPHTDAKHITLHTDLDDGVTVSANGELLTRLLTNLLTNAYKYGKENGNIFVSLKEEQSTVLLRVKDDGIGIAAKDVDKIFDNFYRADNSRSRPGFGLGLSFVKRIAELHGGTVTLNSVEGLGSEFTVTLKKWQKN